MRGGVAVGGLQDKRAEIYQADRQQLSALSSGTRVSGIKLQPKRSERKHLFHPACN